MVKFNKLPYKINNIWLTSDTHYSHANIVRGTSNWVIDDNSPLVGVRNFLTVEEHNNALVNGINKYVGENDLLISLGDWSFGNEKNIGEFRERLKVKEIMLCLGNHDHHIREDIVKYSNYFDYIEDLVYLCVGKFNFMCCHYPMLSWYGQGRGVSMFFGHCHSNLKVNGKSIDVGVDSAYKLYGEYRPFNLLELKELMDKIPLNTVDHH